MNLHDVLPVVWFFIIGFGVLMYVLLDGFVLGLGILAPFADDEHQRDHMMNTAAPIWDGNETWLVMGGAGLMAAFPRAYAVILSALYLPILLMLIALVFRGVAFEFRFKAERSRWVWGVAFHLGSVAAAFAQGVILGALVEGMPLKEGKYIGGALGWFSPFAMLTGVALIFGYALLGATWLILKTEGRLQRIAFDLTRPLMLVVICCMFLVSVSLPFLDSQLMQRWFTLPNFLYLSPVPLLTALNAAALWFAVIRNRELAPFLLSLSFFGLGFLGLVLGIWPNIVPPDLSLWQAAAPPSSQGFTLVGAAIMLPAVLFYTAYSYRVFRGKVAADAGYH
ncbi:cytochrome bd-I ubiquinol oxidase subunit 2 apoprotein [Tahibacter aquaticus]|uniref:Cytochrome bd-I ubiquinol oxidase subunit 2 apoprotein n=1 Tax=Tahibacter aquaticus TaxID=520092 RepID=A0A4V3DNM1_9GAMM|nr:cytochrome d ubiquinol oxidase subunit II [Tahibacter aquaticus]TDR48866.1 cytochrome bd-I ubiquinol oxidase subunit 2 apoprotein [Tahibacter aquaticus]